MKDTVYIAVVGGEDAPPEHQRLAEEVGRALARRGAVLVCGGLGGVMEAACRGAKAERGTTVGILPTDDRSAGNDYLDVALATGMREMRNTLVVRCADAVIAVDGEFGTLSEIAFAVQIGKPVIGLDTWALATPADGHDPIVRVSSPEEAVERALASSS